MNEYEYVYAIEYIPTGKLMKKSQYANPFYVVEGQAKRAKPDSDCYRIVKYKLEEIIDD